MEAISGILKQQFNQSIELREKRLGLMQLYAPFFHADGDMMDIFIRELDGKTIRISDEGLTLMRLSYQYEVDTANKRKIFNRIVNESHVNVDDKGNIFLDCPASSLYPGLMQFTGAVTKVTNMRLFKRAWVQSEFLEQLDEYVMSGLSRYLPQRKYHPLPEKDEYEVDYCVNHRPRPLYLFGVNNDAKARLSTISCQKFISSRIRFSSLIILSDLEDVSRKDQARLMSAADKQFPSLDDFKEHAVEYIEREA
jgi:hypothetical protein